jgi:hypothetical protein
VSREKAQLRRWEQTTSPRPYCCVEERKLGRWEPKEGAWEMVRVAASSQPTTSTRPYCRVEGRRTRSGGSGGGERRNSKKEITACHGATAAARVTRRNRVGALTQALAAPEDGWRGWKVEGRGVSTTFLVASTLAPAAISRSTTSQRPFQEASISDVAPFCDARRTKLRSDGYEPHTGSTRMCARETGGGRGGVGELDGTARACVRERARSGCHARGDRTGWFSRRALIKTHHAVMAQMPVFYRC